VQRAADASRQLGDRKNFGRLLEEIRCQLHSSSKFNHRDHSTRTVYFVRSLVRAVSTDASKIGAPQTLEIEDCCVTSLIILDCVTLLRR